MTKQRTVVLTPPSVSPDHILEKLVCIRAHRERIFQVSTVMHDRKLICHNYGHGGAGWTFLFGCVNASLRLYNQHCTRLPSLAKEPIAVIGAGCHGLLTALILARQGKQVRIIAQDNTTMIPSYKAAGFFFPRPRKSSTEQERTIFEQFGMESYTLYRQIALGCHPFITRGAQLLPAYYGSDIDPGFDPYIQHGLMEKPETVIIDFGNSKRYQAQAYTAIFIDAVIIMQELHTELAKLSVPIITDTINNFCQISESVIFNCAGKSAGLLAGDTRIVPVQGHLITLQQQPDMSKLNYMINVKVTMRSPQGHLRDELIYYAPKGSGILGITFIRGQDSLTANQHEFDRLLQRSMDFFGTPGIN